MPTPSPVSRISQLLSGVVSSAYANQAVTVSVMDENQLFVEVCDNTRVLALNEADSFEEVLKNLIQWIELCLTYSWSRNPETLRLLQRASSYYCS